MEGWIKIHRKLITWEWYNDSKMVHLFLHLLLSANHSKGKWQGIDINRGQLITGRIKLSAITGISEQSIRTCLNKLESTKELTIKTTSKNSIITLLNYDSYQINESANQQSNQPSTSNQPAINQQSTTNKNVKNKDNENNNKEYREFAHLKLSLEDFKKLNEKYSKESIDDTLNDIENYSQNKKYKSLYLTASKWLKKDQKEISAISFDTNR